MLVKSLSHTYTHTHTHTHTQVRAVAEDGIVDYVSVIPREFVLNPILNDVLLLAQEEGTVPLKRPTCVCIHTEYTYIHLLK
jgi:hypothetical protein